MERTLDDSANRRISLPEAFLCADAILRLIRNIAGGLRVNEKVIDKTLREYMPFLATENLMMEAVKRGGNRQQLHEIISRCSMAATEKMKQGEPCDLLERLAAEKDFGLTEEEMRSVMDPAKYTGRCGAQVTALADKLRPLFAEATETKDSIDL
jgi:adenylosuccinate lyase